ncbi:MAG: hypothetical protein O7F13_04390, partial [Gammaproteobacteria bacterium]|nr:hypothetical protein [Gammaproteobacteria bacterium]
MNDHPVIAVSFLLALVAAINSCGGGSSGPVSQPPPVSLETGIQRVFNQLTFNLPVALIQAPSDISRWFVVEQSGVIRVFNNDPTVSSSSVFIDISGRVNSGPSEAGLLGMAF